MKDVKIRDTRNKDWFRLDNEYLNGYAKIFGAVGTAIYVSLCRHADNDTQACFPSMEQIAKELGISRKTVWTYIKRFEQHNLILREEQRRQEGSKRFQNCTYFLLDKSEWKKHPGEGSREQPLHTGAVSNGYTTPCVNDDTSREYQLHSNNTHKNNTHLKKTQESEKRAGGVTVLPVFPLSGEPRAKVFEILGSETELTKFQDYWTERSATGIPRWKGQKFFELKHRARTWAERAARDRAKTVPRAGGSQDPQDRPRYVSGLPGAFTFAQIKEMLASGKIRTESDYAGKITYIINDHAPQT